MKVYVIRYEDKCNDEFSSGVLGIFDNYTKAQNMIKDIKLSEIENTDIKNIKDLISDLIYENGFIIDYIDDYTKYVIEEMECK